MTIKALCASLQPGGAFGSLHESLPSKQKALRFRVDIGFLCKLPAGDPGLVLVHSRPQHDPDNREGLSHSALGCERHHDRQHHLRLRIL